MITPDKTTKLAGPEKLNAIGHEQPGLALTFPPAPFFRRVAAFLIDLLVLSVLYYMLEKLAFFGLDFGLFSGPLLYFLGHFDRLVSAAIALAYFSIFSSAGSGGTPGQRILKLKVRDLKGQTLTFRRALLRSAFLAPFFLCFGRSVPAQPGSFLALLESELVFGLFGTIVCLLIFNRKTGRSFHDLLAETRVVYQTGTPGQPYQATPLRRVFVAAFVAFTIPLIIWGVNQNSANTINPNLSSQLENDLSQILLKDPSFIDVSLVEGFRQEPGQLPHKDLLMSVTINTWDKHFCGYWCGNTGIYNLLKDYLATAGYIFDDFTVQTVEIFDLGFFKMVTTSVPVRSHGTFKSTYQWTFLGLFSSSFSFENI